MDVRSLIQQALPNALGGLIAAIVILLVSSLWKLRDRIWIRNRALVKAIDPERKNGQYGLLMVSAVVISLVLFFEFVGPAISDEFV
jgi:hypothetical protein